MKKIEIKSEAIKRAIEKHESKYSSLHFTEKQIRKDWENYIEEPMNTALEFIMRFVKEI